MISDLLLLLGAAAAGCGLGWFYFGGLWLTVRRLPAATMPGLLALSSLLIRLSVTLIVFLLVTQGRWERLIACLCGFLLVRMLLLRHLKPERQRAIS